LTKQSVNIGSVANDGTGTTLRAGGTVINSNFNEIYAAIGDGTDLKIDVTGAVADNVLKYDGSLNKFIPDTVATTYQLFVSGSSGSTQVLNSGDTLTIQAGSGINTVASAGDVLSVSIDNTVATLTGNQTLQNKSITSPIINGGVVLTATSTELNLLSGATGIVTDTSSVTLTNKTISGTNNTLTNINATSIGNGTVSNTEFQYLDGVTSNIQNQLYALSIALGS